MARKAKPKRAAVQKRELPETKQAAFLSAYATCGNITAAARAAGCGRSQHYDWLGDPDYERAFQLAHAEACESLEIEARRRAVDGWHEPVIYQGELQFLPKFDPKTKTVVLDNLGRPVRSDVPLTVNKRSDVLLIFLMKAAMPSKYRDNWKGEVKDLAGTAARGADLLQTLTDDELQSLHDLTRAASERRRNTGGASATEPEPDQSILS